MKKVLLTYNGKTVSQGVLQFVRHVNEQQPVLLSAIFMAEMVYVNLWNDGSMPMATYYTVVDQEDESVQAAMKVFENTCRESNIACQVQEAYSGLPQADVLEASRFADALVVSSESMYPSFVDRELHPTLHELLHRTECPVVVVPETFSIPDKNLLFYDGSASSVYAIKQFAYLFPELCTKETWLVYAHEKDDDALPEQHHIQQLTAQHFPNLVSTKLQLSVKKDLKAWVEAQHNALLVGGAFGRSGLSETLRKSFMQDLITLRRFPVFIAHK